jgi:hypothetical protein
MNYKHAFHAGKPHRGVQAFGAVSVAVANRLRCWTLTLVPASIYDLSSVEAPGRRLRSSSTFSLRAVEIDAAFASMVQQRIGTLLGASDPFLFNRRDQIVPYAQRFAENDIDFTTPHMGRCYASRLPTVPFIRSLLSWNVLLG